MFTMRKAGSIGAIGLTIFALCCAVACPVALATEFALQGVTFSDGGTASGDFAIDTYGYFTAPANTVATTTGTAVAGYDYALATTAPSVTNPPDTSVYFSRTGADIGVLELTFEYALDAVPDGNDPILSGFECQAYTCTALNERTVTAGSAAFVPEPLSLALLGGAALGFAAVRRRAAGA